MDERGVREWFRAYLATFAALGRGDDDDLARLLAYYSVPLLVSTDAGTTVLSDEAAVLGLVRQQVDGMRAAGYDRSRELGAETTVLNDTCAGHRARFARIRTDGSEISRLEVTYLVTDRPEGRRISALVLHSPG